MSSQDADENCVYDEEGYRVEWQYDPETKMVDFDLTAAQPRQSDDFWTGIAFGPGMVQITRFCLYSNFLQSTHF